MNRKYARNARFIARRSCADTLQNYIQFGLCFFYTSTWAESRDA